MIRPWLYDDCSMEQPSHGDPIAFEQMWTIWLPSRPFCRIGSQLPSLYFLQASNNTMILHLLLLDFFMLLQSVAVVDSFPTILALDKGPWRSSLPGSTFETRLAASVDKENAVQCFIVNAFEVDEEGAEPEIVCTPEPDEYAWFNGIEREHMKPAQSVTASGDFLECMEGASPRGVPEWECKKKRSDDNGAWN